MKSKIILFLLCTSLMCSNIATFADETEFNANEAFKNYVSFDDSQVNESWKHYYIVSKSNDDNSKALFSEGQQLTDFIYNSINISGCGIIVSQKKDNTEYFGLISDEDYKELLPVKYKSIEDYEVIGYIAENIDGSKEYYIVKTPVNEAPNNVDYKETDKLYILNSYDDLKTTLGISESEPILTPIEGMDNCYIMLDGSTFYVNIVNEKGEKLVETNFRSVENRLGDYDTLIVHYPEGMNDSSIGLLSRDFKTIVPKNFYSSINFITSNNQIYVEAKSYIDGSLDYYDLNGNKVNAPNNFESIDNSYSKWAEESIKKSIELGLVPQNLQSKYTDKITRGEFCQLAVQTYITKTGNEINMNVETPFTDVNDAYITTAYNLKIVSGVGDDKFAPNNYITRQEAAVMLNNLASVLNIDNSTPQSEKFVDESYFADWAKSAIYSVAGIKSRDTYVMTGTGNGKFSPWMNYTREQAVATMYRLFNCESKEFGSVDKSDSDNYVYFESGNNSNKYIMRLSKDGKNMEQLACGGMELNIEKIVGDYIYYSELNADKGCILRVKKDGSDDKSIAKDRNIRDFYVGKNNIYYIKANEGEQYDSVIKMDLNGEKIKKFDSNKNLDLISLLAENDGIAYLDVLNKEKQASSIPEADIYELNFDTMEFVESDIINYKAYDDEAVTDGKYMYYKVPQAAPTSQPVVHYDVYKCDMDRSNETELNVMNVSDGKRLFPYKNCMYTIIEDDGCNIARVYGNGGSQAVTNYRDYNYMIDILEISEGIIYYKMTGDTDTKICSVNVNGMDNKVLYEF